jgi:hypothetical protein
MNIMTCASRVLQGSASPSGCGLRYSETAVSASSATSSKHRREVPPQRVQLSPEALVLMEDQIKPASFYCCRASEVPNILGSLLLQGSADISIIIPFTHVELRSTFFWGHTICLVVGEGLLRDDTTQYGHESGGIEMTFVCFPSISPYFSMIFMISLEIPHDVHASSSLFNSWFTSIEFLISVVIPSSGVPQVEFRSP